jgi:hypothetical protein
LWDTARAYDEVLNQVLVCSRNPPDQAPKDWQAVSVDDARIFFEQVKGRPSKTHEIADEEDMLLAQMAIRAKNR